MSNYLVGKYGATFGSDDTFAFGNLDLLAVLIAYTALSVIIGLKCYDVKFFNQRLFGEPWKNWEVSIMTLKVSFTELGKM